MTPRGTLVIRERRTHVDNPVSDVRHYVPVIEYRIAAVTRILRQSLGKRERERERDKWHFIHILFAAI